MFHLCGHFHGKQDTSACITVVWDMSMRRSRINVVPFHIKVCFYFYFILFHEAVQRGENVKSQSHKARTRVKCQEQFLSFRSLGTDKQRSHFEEIQVDPNSISFDSGISVRVKLQVPFRKARHTFLWAWICFPSFSACPKSDTMSVIWHLKPL